MVLGLLVLINIDRSHGLKGSEAAAGGKSCQHGKCLCAIVSPDESPYMIDRKEIEAKAKQLEVKISDVQRDYVFGWLLHGLFSVSGLRDEIFLKGGNALRKGYLENTRYSGDLDFGIPNDISQERLLDELNKVCDFVQERAGVAFIKDRSKVEEKFTAAEAPLPDLKVYEANIYFKDFYGNPERFTIRIAMDITRFDRTLLPIQTRPLIHPYSDADKIVCSIR
jgi:hypothetical protein